MINEMVAQEIRSLFAEGYGKETICRVLKIPAKRVEKFMAENGLRRTREEAMKFVAERNRAQHTGKK
jgi:uncharacterized protein YoaH (UPF0181 family)